MSHPGSLLWLIDHTQTAPGAALLREWLARPLLQAARIAQRQEAVSVLAFDDPPSLRAFRESGFAPEVRVWA